MVDDSIDLLHTVIACNATRHNLFTKFCYTFLCMTVFYLPPIIARSMILPVR